MIQQTPRQRLQETLRRNAKSIKVLPKWVKNAISTTEVFCAIRNTKPTTKMTYLQELAEAIQKHFETLQKDPLSNPIIQIKKAVAKKIEEEYQFPSSSAAECVLVMNIQASNLDDINLATKAVFQMFQMGMIEIEAVSGMSSLGIIKDMCKTIELSTGTGN